MSGTVLAVGITAGLASLVVVSLPACGVLVTRQAVVAAADAAALAAADVARGLVPGFPCEVAGRVAAANGSTVASCGLDGYVATVTVGRSILGFQLSASATAGPPSEAPN